MVEIGDRPIVWHIMKRYEMFEQNNFILALGYKGEFIKDYFLNYHANQSDISIKLNTGEFNLSNQNSENWEITLVDTGQKTMTGGRLLRLKPFLINENTFMLTYGDGVCDVNISKLIEFHKSHGKIATVTAVRPPVRFGELMIEDNHVKQFQEKPQATEGWINGGYFVFQKEIFDFIKDDSTLLERDPLESLANLNELMAFKHNGFWQCMDTIRDRDNLQDLWNSGNAPWIK
jgi:glucose-1-phosphate cytidylyltransferase